MDIHPHVALMRRYCIDYTNVHDLSVCDDLMRDDYTVTVSGRTLDMPSYREAVAGAFRRFPTLGLTVHELLLSDDRFAMRFSEHGASSRHDGRVAVWRGLSMYRWDGEKLLTCDVEQDFMGRERQLVGGQVDPLDAQAPDPWATTVPVAADPKAAALVTQWLQVWAARGARGDLEASQFRLVLDDSDLVGPDDFVINDPKVEISDVIAGGGTVAARMVIRGLYGGGLSGVDPSRNGRDCELPSLVWAHTTDDGITDVQIIRDRWGLQRRLR